MIGVGAILIASFGLVMTASAAGISKSEITRILSEQGYAVRDFSPGMVAVVVGEHVVLVGC